jgi:RNA polymerase sigma factor (sigma-70 family)
LNEPEGPTLTELVTAAINDDRQAWNQLVERFTSLVIGTARRYRLPEHDIADVAQTVWLHLVEHLADLREPDALPGWLASTTRNECVRSIGRKARQRPFDPQGSFEADHVSTPDIAADVAEDVDRFSRQQAMLAGFAELSDSDRQLLTLLVADPPLSYAQISQQLNMPIGSIGPNRGRALKRLRATAPVSRLVDSES